MSAVVTDSIAPPVPPARSVMVTGLTIVPGPDGDEFEDSVTVPVKPFKPVTVTAEVLEPPGLITRLAGSADNVKLAGPAGRTFTMMSAECDSDPLVAVIVTL